MKKIIALTLLALMTLCSAEELKVTTLEVKKINYQNGKVGDVILKVVCINGYKWLQKDGEYGSISQMFTEVNNQPRLVKCEN